MLTSRRKLCSPGKMEAYYNQLSWHGYKGCCNVNLFCLSVWCFCDSDPLVLLVHLHFSGLECLTQLQGRGTRHLNTDSAQIACMQGSQRARATKPLGAFPEETGQLQVCGYSEIKSLDPELRGLWSSGAAVSQCSSTRKYCDAILTLQSSSQCQDLEEG